ncbi:hypothetical protein SDC9_197431 [bioreactor metagenome]|uniref:Uncharacterized protein n=1 Tax=bioreactor metagenome TaxID=1076179 RepID=A0A645IH59_9ZZZZ
MAVAAGILLHTVERLFALFFHVQELLYLLFALLFQSFLFVLVVRDPVLAACVSDKDI